MPTDILTPEQQHQQWLAEWEQQTGATPGRHNPKAAAREAIVSRRAKDTDLLRIMRVARLLVQPFRKNDLVIGCFRRYPEPFALKGFPEYPDSNLVLCYLYGRRGLVSSGLIERVGTGVYRVRGE
jgi:hypothetical protein